MAEQVTLTAPVFVDAGATVFAVAALVLDREAALIKVRLKEWTGTAFVVNGKALHVSYEGPAATTLLVALNKTNLTTRSLVQRVLDRLLADGKLPAGTVAGSVD